jgi:hypothetical protein
VRIIKVDVTEKMANMVWSPSSLDKFCGTTEFVGGCGVRLFLDKFAGPTYDVYRKHFCFGTTAHEILENYHAGDKQPPLEQMLDDWLPNLWIASEYKKKFAKKFGENFLAKMEADLPLSVKDFAIPDGSTLTVEELRAGFPQVGDITKYLMRGEARRWMFLGFDSADDEMTYRKMLASVLKDYYRREYVKPLSIEDPMDIEVDGIKVIGRIDRVDRRKLGFGYTVIDYKTSKKMKTVPEMHNDFQMVCYHMATKQRYNVDDSGVQVGLLYLKPETKVNGVYVPQPVHLQIAEIKSEMIARTRSAIKQAHEMVTTGQFHYVDDKGKWKCPWCDHYGVCGYET